MMRSTQARRQSPQRSHRVMKSVSLGAYGGRTGARPPLRAPRKNCLREIERIALRLGAIGTAFSNATPEEAS
jgi:hypothetical protein